MNNVAIMTVPTATGSLTAFRFKTIAGFGGIRIDNNTKGYTEEVGILYTVLMTSLVHFTRPTLATR
jgi:hypothetical protein